MDSTGLFLFQWAEAIWEMIVDSALLLLLSFALAGLLSLVLNAKNIQRLVSGGKRREVLVTALVGVPLPLCSCSVLPVAYQLRRAGVSKAGTASFLIATPESGVDSILLTYSLMDPVMALARPIAAFLTAFTAGNVEAAFPDSEHNQNSSNAGRQTQPAVCCTSCGCSNATEQTAPIELLDQIPPNPTLLSRLKSGIRYGFTDLFNDLAVYLLIGYVLAGLVVVIFGGQLMVLPEWLMSGWGAYLGAIVIGLPLYICATSSTPLAAALLVAGFSPGAVLVFLLVGPATNIASLAVVSKILKGPAMVRYLASILVVAIVCGIAIDWIYRTFNLPVIFRSGGHEHAAWYHLVAGAIFIILLAQALARRVYFRFNGKTAPVISGRAA